MRPQGNGKLRDAQSSCDHVRKERRQFLSGDFTLGCQAEVTREATSVDADSEADRRVSDALTVYSLDSKVPLLAPTMTVDISQAA